jgi:superfamily II DNA or RNA helicase
MLNDLKLKSVYRSDTDHILRDFYIPALKESITYDRAVGYFSAGMLSCAAQGLSSFIENDGRMRLIIGGGIQADDLKAIEEGYNLREISNKLGIEFIKAIESVDDAIFYRRLELISWLIACNRLDIKIALKRKGMYHEKIGIFTDLSGQRVVFNGSANETPNALLQDFNFESIAVYPSWREELKDYYDTFIKGFDNLWKNKTLDTLVIDFPDVAKEKLFKIAKKQTKFITPSIEIDLWEKFSREQVELDDTSYLPQVPSTLNGEEFKIKEHQKKALESWRANSLSGVMALATGAGKTITAIYGAVKIFEAEKKLFLAIAVPYQNLADQWVEILHKFNIYPIKCYANADAWLQKLSEAISLYQSGTKKFACLVVVNRTLQSENFQNLVKQIPGKRLLWVGDECHHHGSIGLNQSLPQHAEMRLGLSATPENYFDEEATNRILDYYGQIISTYSMKEALDDKVLTPYKYYVSVVSLTVDEAEEYKELSEQISRLNAISKTGGGKQDIDRLKNLLFRRARLLSRAKNKFLQLRKLLSSTVPNKLTLFYCGDGSTEDEESGEIMRQVEIVTSILRENNWKSSIFTSTETRQEKANLLDFFRIGLIDALVAIRCLDEGIDIPACKTAYILASSKNPKQFIQRRGRILRKSLGKDFAEIHDFVVTIPEEMIENSDYERNLIRSELERVAEFARLSLNHAESIRALKDTLKIYNLSHLII